MAFKKEEAVMVTLTIRWYSKKAEPGWDPPDDNLTEHHPTLREAQVAADGYMKDCDPDKFVEVEIEERPFEEEP